MVVTSKAVVEPIEEDEEVDMGEGSSTENLAPKQVAATWPTMPMVPGFWAISPSGEVTRRGLAARLRARGKCLPYMQTQCCWSRQTKTWHASSK